MRAKGEDEAELKLKIRELLAGGTRWVWVAACLWTAMPTRWISRAVTAPSLAAGFDEA